MGVATTPNGDYSVNQFGSISLAGNVDDGPAINQALAQISANGGGRLLTKAGKTAGIATTVNLPSNCELVIVAGSTLQAIAGLVGPVVQNLDLVNGNAGIRITGGGTIDGNRAASGAAATHGIALTKCDDAHIDVNTKNAYLDGINLTTCKRPVLNGLSSLNGRHGIYYSTVTFARSDMTTRDNGARVAGNGLTLDVTSTDNTGLVVATDTGPATQLYGIQEVAASGCNRNVFVGSCQGNVTGPTSFIGAASQLFTQPSLSNPTITGTVAGAATYSGITATNPVINGNPIVTGAGYGWDNVNLWPTFGDGIASHGVVSLDQVQSITGVKTLTNPKLAGAIQTADGQLAYAAHLLSAGDGTINRPLGLYKIGEVVTAGSQATVNLAGIAAFYRHLRIEGVIKQSAAAALALRFNGDAAGNYQYCQTIRSTNPVPSATSSAQTSMVIAPASAGPSTFSFIVDIPLYAAPITEQYVYASAQSAALLAYGTDGSWSSVIAINSILFLLSVGNFVDGSVITWYGVV